MREDWTAAGGVEIENRRMLGKRTLFIYDEPMPKIGGYTHLNDPVPPVIPYQHIYFTQQYLSKNGFDKVAFYTDRFEITLELSLDLLDKIPRQLWNCHFVVSLVVKDLDKYIKLSDTIRILLDNYHTASITFADMLVTHPTDYIGDTCAGRK